MKKVLLLVLILTVIFGCGKKKEQYEVLFVNGKKTIKNYNVNSRIPHSKKLKKRLTILSDYKTENSFSKISDVKVDKNRNIFILDSKMKSIYKYDDKGVLIKRIGKKGNGPGEFIGVSNFVLANDIILIPDHSAKKINKFDLNGEFLSAKNLKKASSLPENLISLNDSLLCGTQVIPVFSKEGIFFKIQLNLFDLNFNVLKIIEEKKIPFDPSKGLNPSKMEILFTVSKNKKEIAVAKNSSEIYKINVYNFLGEYSYSFTKTYRKISLSEEERKLQIKQYKKSMKGLPIKIENKYINSISSIFYDNLDYLWIQRVSVNSSSNNEPIYDVYENGIHFNSISLKFDDKLNNKLIIDRDNFIVINEDMNSVSIFNNL